MTTGNEQQPPLTNWTASLLSIALRNRSDNEVLVRKAEFDIEAVTKLGCGAGLRTGQCRPVRAGLSWAWLNRGGEGRPGPEEE
ncbi:hypothetical protein [Streptomyces sp. NPDC056524]|uniref:hypothetical protein n=1 Tax=Streptomyces sp. NPDC056524 TaxID=3345851 RepID=UPI0036CCFB41